MVEVTEADKVLLRALDIPASASDLLVVAMHREAAAKAERDRIVAWLRDQDGHGEWYEAADALDSKP